MQNHILLFTIISCESIQLALHKTYSMQGFHALNLTSGKKSIIVAYAYEVDG